MDGMQSCNRTSEAIHSSSRAVMCLILLGRRRAGADRRCRARSAAATRRPGEECPRRGRAQCPFGELQCGRVEAASVVDSQVRRVTGQHLAPRCLSRRIKTSRGDQAQRGQQRSAGPRCGSSSVDSSRPRKRARAERQTSVHSVRRMKLVRIEENKSERARPLTRSTHRTTGMACSAETAAVTALSDCAGASV